MGQFLDLYSSKVKKMKKLINRVKRIGITGLTMPEAVKLLVNNKIDIVIDVRQNTEYKGNQGFSPKEFKDTLEAKGINYIYLKTLGNPYHWRYKEELTEANNDKKKIKEIANRAKAEYLEYLQKEYTHIKQKDLFPRERFDTLYHLIAHKRVSFKKNYCFVCYCPFPAECHTYWIIEAMINKKRQELGLLEDNFILDVNIYSKFSLDGESNYLTLDKFFIHK